jgi:hypothetical protein
VEAVGNRVPNPALSDLADELAKALDKPRSEVLAALDDALEVGTEPLKATWPPEVETR